MGDETHYLLPKQRNLSKGSKSWYGGISVNGIVHWVSLSTKSHKVAMEWFGRMQASRYAPEQQEAKPVDIEAAADAFVRDVENVRRREAGTVRIYRQYLKQFKAWCKEKGITDIRKVTSAICLEFAQFAFANAAANTAKNKVIMFRHFYSWIAEHYGINGKNPFKKIVVAKPKPVPRAFWTVEECEKIIAAASSEEYKCYFALMAFAGLRREEARLLKMENLANGKISLTGKGGKHAELPISKRLKTHLNKYLSIRGTELGALLPSLAKLTRIGQCQCDQLRNAVEKSKIQSSGQVHFHRFRHSFASNLLRTGRSIKAVQMLMRHEDVALTLRTYSHLLPSDLEEAVEL